MDILIVGFLEMSSENHDPGQMKIQGRSEYQKLIEYVV